MGHEILFFFTILGILHQIIAADEPIKTEVTPETEKKEQVETKTEEEKLPSITYVLRRKIQNAAHQARSYLTWLASTSGSMAKSFTNEGQNWLLSILKIPIEGMETVAHWIGDRFGDIKQSSYFSSTEISNQSSSSDQESLIKQPPPNQSPPNQSPPSNS